MKIINRHSENKQLSIDIQRIKSGSYLHNFGFVSPK